jgi:hypothetical protein
MWYRLFFLMFLGLSPSIWAKTIVPMSFSHENWEMVCSNTGTCQAAGYGDEDEGAASILLKRLAGAYREVTAQWVVGNFDEGFDETLKGTSLAFYVNGKHMGQVKVTDMSVGLGGVLSTAQKNAVLSTAKQNSVYEFKTDDMTWVVSGKGMAAVLLKMDEFQKRLDTKGALIQKGSQDESQVLLPQAKQVIKKVATADKPYLILKPKDPGYEALKTRLAPNGDCVGLDSDWHGVAEYQNIEVYRLNAQKSAVQALCWQGAYNMGYGVWVMDSSLQGEAELVTDSATYLASGEILASHRGRGLGGCWSLDQWIWNGKQFIQSQSMSTGQCQGISVGGTWNLHFIETKVIGQ